MNSKVSFVIGLVIGALAGAGGSYYALNQKNEQLLKEKEASLKDIYDSELKKIIERNNVEKEKISEKYKEVTDTFGYSEYRMPSDVPVDEPPVQDPRPDIVLPDPEPVSKATKKRSKIAGGVDSVYEIDAEEYGRTTYIPVNLNYYSDGVLTDEDDQPLTDDFELVPDYILDTLDERVQKGYEDVYVRNDELGRDYRISLIDVSSNS